MEGGAAGEEQSLLREVTQEGRTQGKWVTLGVQGGEVGR